MTHDNNRYQSGCRCSGCRHAHAAYMRLYRLRRAANGGKVTETGIVGGRLFQPSGPVRDQLVELRRSMSARRIAVEAGVSTKTVRELLTGTRSRVHPSVAARVDGLWRDVCHVAPAGRLPAAPLRAVAFRRFPGPDRPGDSTAGVSSVLCEADRRLLYRSEIPVPRAERVCRLLGVYPEDVWGPGWEWMEESA